MLSSIDLNAKSYDDLIEEAIAKIPLYSGEWTNFNPSDPGITILENFSAFTLLQQNYINEVTDEARRALLKLLGFQARSNEAASLLLSMKQKKNIHFPAQMKLKVGDIPFETDEALDLHKWDMRAAYSAAVGEEYKDVTYLLDPTIPAEAAAFGSKPEVGSAFYLILDDIPEKGRPAYFWFAIQNEERRNPFDAEEPITFVRTTWQCYTAEGWKNIPVTDETEGFLISGMVCMDFKKLKPMEFSETPVKGYALRCMLREGQYDCPPKISAITANLFEVKQQDTRVAVYDFYGGKKAVLTAAPALRGNLIVYCRERGGEPYRLYQAFAGRQRPGRFYERMEYGDRIELLFDKERFSYGPGAGTGAIRVVCYDDEIVHSRNLGTVWGYEEQEIELGISEKILETRFQLLAETTERDGETGYIFVSPGKTNPDELCYEVLPEGGRIVIHHPGIGRECRLILASCAVTKGRIGNIRPGNELETVWPIPGKPKELFSNPAPGRNGETYETVEELRKRFITEMKKPYFLVTANDYEKVVSETPGLAIHKVKAIANSDMNNVTVIVKPYNDKKLPRLTPIYTKQIRQHIEKRRMLTTRVELKSPNYVPIDVSGRIYVQSYFENAVEEIQNLIYQELDGAEGPMQFGATVRFYDLYEKIRKLPCVKNIFDLKLIPQGRGASQYGSDIRMDEESLCFARKVEIIATAGD